MFENCAEIREQFSDYQDGVAAPDVVRSIRFHTQYCDACRRELALGEEVHDLLRALPRHPVKPAADLRLRVRMSQELNRNYLGRLWVRLDNQFRRLVLSTTGGVLVAVFCFCLLMGSEVAPVSKLPDVPLSFDTPARVINLAPLNFAPGDRPVVVVTYIGFNGRVIGYKVLSGQSSPDLMRHLDRLIYYSRYSPAMAFGRPTDGTVVLSFSQVTIRG